MPFNLGLPELLVIAFLAILFFGRDKIVDLARGTGEATKEFKKAIRDDEPEEDLVVVKKKPAKKRTTKKPAAKKKPTSKKTAVKKTAAKVKKS